MLEGEYTARLPESAIGNLEEPPPWVTADLAADAARELFGLRVTAARLLPGERDRNFLLEAGGERFVMKVVHPAETPEVSALQARLLLHLGSRGVPAQSVVEPVAGREPILAIDGTPPVVCLVRCVTYLPGRQMAEVIATPRRWRGLGRFLAQVDMALADLVEPGADRPFLWDIQRIEQLRPLVEYVGDQERRRRTIAVLDEFRDDVLPRMRELRTQVIHNDANPQNVLVAAEDPDRIEGVIDFGDAVYGPLAQELAVAISYQPLTGARPFEAAVEITRGYHELHQLTQAELELIPPLVMTRLALTTVITAWRSALHPGNAPYIMRNDRTIEANLGLGPAVSDRAGVERFVTAVLDSGKAGGTT